MNFFKRAVAAVSLVMFMQTLTACGPKASTNNPPEELKGSIKVLVNKNDMNAANTTVKNFKEKFPLTDVEVKELTDMNEQADLIMMKDQDVPSVLKANEGKFMDLSSEMNSDRFVFRRTKDNYSAGWYATPWVAAYKKDVFEQASMDTSKIKTWEDFYYKAVELNKKNGSKVVFAGDAGSMYLIFLCQLRCEMLNKDNQFSIDEEKGLKASRVMRYLLSNNIFIFSNNVQDAIKNNGPAIVITGSNNLPLMLGDNGEQKDKWTISKLPAFEPGGNGSVSIGGSSILMNKNTKNEKVAREFLKFAMRDGVNGLDLIRKYGIVPVDSEMYGAKEFTSSSTYSLLGNIQKQAPAIRYSTWFSDVHDIVNKNVSLLNRTDVVDNEMLKNMQKELNDKIQPSKTE